jgi:peptidyl-prolyl cis-trans isomerase-like 1
MVQGGDPTGTGRGGKSIYGCARAQTPLDPRELCVRSTFEDELTVRLKHTGAGVRAAAPRIRLQPAC